MPPISSRLFLPKEVSAFERDYLARMNRIGLWFFAGHVPALAAIAALNGTGALRAALLSLGVLAGPLLASRVFADPRRVSTSFGFASMLMGGLLVHFGQGPMQIEMHFYFFVLIALLAVYANPAVILTAAATVAGHHLLGWLLLPSSVFNYEAPVWVVAVHAGFVVLESVAACFIARSFFDNVIGLEKIVARRTRELDGRNRDMRLVLDNVRQGFLTIDPGGLVSAEYSAIVEDWYGRPRPTDTFGTLLGRVAPRTSAAFEVAWSEVVDGVLPLEVTLDQLPRRFDHDGKHFELAYQPILDEAGALAKVLVVTTDITASVERERIEREQRETMTVIERIAKDRHGFLEFVEDAERILDTLARPATEATILRCVHTLKGNASVFGLQSVADACHAVESSMKDAERPFDEGDRDALASAWRRVKASLALVLGDERARGIEIDDEELVSVLRAALARMPHAELAERIAAWRLEPTAKRLARLAGQTQGIAARLGKDVTVTVEDGGLRLDPGRWSPFWSSFIHVVRNAVDHGIESREVRDALGKGSGHVHIATRVTDDRFVVSVEDDGSGLVWDSLREKAKELGLPHASREDLVEAVFAEGVSTAATVTDLSGRGVGLGAVRAEARRLGGTATIETAPGRGTRFVFSFPREAMRPRPEELLAAA